MFDIAWAIEAAKNNIDENDPAESGLDVSFVAICDYLFNDPTPTAAVSKVAKKYSGSMAGIEKLAKKYFGGFRRIDYPKMPKTTPDEVVSIILEVEFHYPKKDLEYIRDVHSLSMNVENCIGSLLERYLDSNLRRFGWHFCCGGFVPSVDFIHRGDDGNWFALQIKNRDNSENSSSSKIRLGTTIEPWFRTFSRTGLTNWDRVPPAMQNKGLSEAGFKEFVLKYLESNRPQNKVG